MTQHAEHSYSNLGIRNAVKKLVFFLALFGSMSVPAFLCFYITQKLFSSLVDFPPGLGVVLTVLTIIMTYEPLKSFLGSTIDRYLFKEKFDYHKLLKD